MSRLHASLSSFIITVLIVFGVASPAHAESYTKTTLDQVLISADAMVFATVQSLEEVRDGLIEVRLGNLNVVTTRWELSGLLTIRVFARFGADGSVRPLRHQPPLRVGTRYLLLLRGGEFTVAPVLRITEAIYEVTASGVTLCPGGEVYGVHPGGLACSSKELETQSPPTEKQLKETLLAAAHDARARRPEFASETDRAALPLYLPTGD